MHKAVGLVEIKGMDDEQRIIRGVATTGSLDRQGDIVDPKGVKTAKDIPLFLYHDSNQTVGRASLGKAQGNQIPFEAWLPKIAEPGRLKERVDEAWHMLKYKLVTGVSIGFNALGDKIERMKEGGYKYLETEVLELSLVPIPANAEATILTVKSAVSGLQKPAGVSAKPNRGTEMELKEMKELRATKAARAEELIEAWKSAAPTAEEQAEFDAIEAELETLDQDIRIKGFQARQAAAATPVRGKSFAEAQDSRRRTLPVTKGEDEAFPGQAFTRMVVAKSLAHANGMSVREVAEARYGKSAPKMTEWISKAAVPGGGTGSGEWGSELVGIDNRYNGDFLEYLYNMTVFDKLALRNVPANVSVKGQDGAATGYWVGESKAIPMSRPDFSTTDLRPLKVAALTVMSLELMEDSSPAAETLVRDSLAEAISQRIDTTFLSNSAAVAGVSPAGMLNGVTAVTASGTDADAFIADWSAVMGNFIAAKTVTGLTVAMNPADAMAIGFLRNAFGQSEFAGLTLNGGTVQGVPVIVSENVPAGTIIFFRPQDIWEIADGGVQVSVSREATIEQDTAPTGATDTPTAASANMTNMFQEDSVAIKLTRRINFQKRRASAVQAITGADYGAAGT